MLMLPTNHSGRELELARRIAGQLGSAELHVFWTARPAEPARRPAPDPPPPLVQGLTTAWALVEAVASALGSRIGSRARGLGT